MFGSYGRLATDWRKQWSMSNRQVLNERVMAMSGMKVGDVIGIQCEVRPGPFSEERLITFETVNGPISGFVRDTELKQADSQWYVRAIIQHIDGDVLDVRVKGSFFTTNGLASVPRRYATAA
jgi:hypothetical protein